MAERKGFEPLRPFWSLHAFQACAFDRSAISPLETKAHTACAWTECNLYHCFIPEGPFRPVPFGAEVRSAISPLNLQTPGQTCSWTKETIVLPYS